jgi:hypothetical protein
MIIDTNTVLMTLMGAITIFFAVGFIRGRLNERFNAFSVRLDNTEDAWWRENERLSSRINALERCCREQSCKSEKSYYNTGA